MVGMSAGKPECLSKVGKYILVNHKSIFISAISKKASLFAKNDWQAMKK